MLSTSSPGVDKVVSSSRKNLSGKISHRRPSVEDESARVAALAHAVAEGAAVELRHWKDQGRAPAQRLLELQPTIRRRPPALAGIPHQLKPADTRPHPRRRTAP